MASKLILLTLIIYAISYGSIIIKTDNSMWDNYLHDIINIRYSRAPNSVYFNGNNISEYYENITTTYYKIDGDYLQIFPIETKSQNTIELYYSSGISSLKSMFDFCPDFIKSISFSNFDMSATTDMDYMFENCNSLEYIYGLNPVNVINMYSTFRDCTSLKYIGFKNYASYNQIKFMKNLFYNCQSLTSIDLSNFFTNKVESMENMFYNCKNLNAITFGSGFSASSVTFMSYMFYNCQNLKSLDLHYLKDSQNVVFMDYMF